MRTCENRNLVDELHAPNAFTVNTLQDTLRHTATHCTAACANFSFLKKLKFIILQDMTVEPTCEKFSHIHTHTHTHTYTGIARRSSSGSNAHAAPARAKNLYLQVGHYVQGSFENVYCSFQNALGSFQNVVRLFCDCLVTVLRIRACSARSF